MIKNEGKYVTKHSEKYDERWRKKEKDATKKTFKQFKQKLNRQVLDIATLYSHFIRAI